MFSRRFSILSILVKLLYRVAFKYPIYFVFQNDCDLSILKKALNLADEKILLTPGSGVNLKRFASNSQHNSNPDKVIFLLMARLIEEKGINDYVDAIKSIRHQFSSKVEFWLMGPHDTFGAHGINLDQIREWETAGLIKFLGMQDDVPAILNKVDVVVLPSYYQEGIPKSLIEALAAGKPIITTDWPGCKETIDEGKNGYLVPIRNVDALASRMSDFLMLSKKARKQMGVASRRYAEKRFDERIVIQVYIDLLERL